MPDRVGLIGLGLMGKPMARNLLRAGFSLTVHNRSRPAVDELLAEGAQAASSARSVAEQSDVVITMLPDTPDVEHVVLGEHGILAGARPGMLLIDMSTIAPASAQRIDAVCAEHGIGALDAPVSGGDAGAIAGTLSIMVGGKPEDLERARPILQALGTTITHCGAAGAGQVVKACNQVAVALIISAISEAIVLGKQSGIAADVIIRVLSGGLAQTRFMDLRAQNYVQQRYQPGGKARFHLKDLRIALDLARAKGAVLPATAQTEQLFAALIAQGGGDLDHSALVMVLQNLVERVRDEG